MRGIDAIAETDQSSVRAGIRPCRNGGVRRGCCARRARSRGRLASEKAVIDFSFGVVGVHRLEARSIASNGRGNAALRKVGACRKACFAVRSSATGAFDQILWSILKDDWRQTKAVWGPRLH